MRRRSTPASRNEVKNIARNSRLYPRDVISRFSVRPTTRESGSSRDPVATSYPSSAMASIIGGTVWAGLPKSVDRSTSM